MQHGDSRHDGVAVIRECHIDTGHETNPVYSQPGPPLHAGCKLPLHRHGGFR